MCESHASCRCSTLCALLVNDLTQSQQGLQGEQSNSVILHHIATATTNMRTLLINLASSKRLPSAPVFHTCPRRRAYENNPASHKASTALQTVPSQSPPSPQGRAGRTL